MSGFTFTLEAGHIAMFARAIGDPSPVYESVESARERGFLAPLAPPTFVEASAHVDPESVVRPLPGRPWFGSSGVATGVPEIDGQSGTTFHAETHLTYTRHPHAGEVLTVRRRDGASWEKTGSRGGQLSFHEFYIDYSDEAGTTVVVDRTVAVTTENNVPVAPVEPGAARRDVVGVAPANDFGPLVERATSRPAPGDERSAELVRDLTRTRIVQFAGASGDFSPQHTDEYFNIHAAGYPTVFGHGMLTMGMSARLLTDWLGDGVLSAFGTRFVQPVWPGDTLIATARIDANPEDPADALRLRFVTTNQRNEPVLKGYAVASWPEGAVAATALTA